MYESEQAEVIEVLRKPVMTTLRPNLSPKPFTTTTRIVDVLKHFIGFETIFPINIKTNKYNYCISVNNVISALILDSPKTSLSFFQLVNGKLFLTQFRALRLETSIGSMILRISGSLS